MTLSPTEYELLHFFMRNPGRFIRFEELYSAVWQRPSMGDLRTLFVHIAHLRQKIEDDPSHPNYIRTYMRDGYIFQKVEGACVSSGRGSFTVKTVPFSG